MGVDGEEGWRQSSPKSESTVMWRQSPGAGVCSLWLRPSILHSTFLHVCTESLHNEVWPDLQYSKETRHESRGLPTITRPDNLWSELQDLMPVMSSKHTPRGLSGYSSKFLSPLHSGVPHVQWIRSGPLGQGGHVDGHTGACDWPTRNLEALLLPQMDQHQGAQGKGIFWMKIFV